VRRDLLQQEIGAANPAAKRRVLMKHHKKFQARPTEDEEDEEGEEHDDFEEASTGVIF